MRRSWRGEYCLLSRLGYNCTAILRCEAVRVDYEEQSEDDFCGVGGGVRFGDVCCAAGGGAGRDVCCRWEGGRGGGGRGSGFAGGDGGAVRFVSQRDFGGLGSDEAG